MLENIPKISAISYESNRNRTETPTSSELLSILQQLKRSNLWLYNSIMSNVDSTMGKLDSYVYNADDKTIIDIKNELAWNSLQCLDVVDRALFGKNIGEKVDLFGYNFDKKEIDTKDGATLKELVQ